ncbi:MAG: coproporphyrinogen III oxidase family protein [Eubacterium sp.]|nr:coproporphyrinogen III oxidase family protein [Eubacterium sp.]
MDNPYVQYMYSYPHKTAYGPLSGIRLEDYIQRLVGAQNSLYFHIPFCQSKCGYCNLFSVTGQSDEFMSAYVDAMERQAEQLRIILPEGADFSDLTLGGGTPLLLSEKQLQRVFSIARDRMGFKGETIIVETSPAQTTEEKVALLKDNGVTRVSMGVQSFDDAELRALNRCHRPEQVHRAARILKKSKFPCINLDLIYGIPGQTVESLLDSARQAAEYEPEEMFVYPLYIKKGTFLAQKVTLNPEAVYEMYQELRDFLKARGYKQLSMRRFVKEPDSLNRGSCGFENTISIGCGGRSYIEDLHFSTPFAVGQRGCVDILQQYMEKKDFLEVTHGYLLSEEEMRRRYVIKNILFCCGIDKEEYRSRFGSEPEEDYPLLTEWSRSGMAAADSAKIYLTERGISLSDFLGPVLMSEEVRGKMEKAAKTTEWGRA